MKNIICIELINLNHDQLKKISIEYNISYSNLVLSKGKNIFKVWIDLNIREVVAYTMRENKDRILYSVFMDDWFNKIEPIVIDKKDKDILDSDGILEKISKYGINSLTSLEISTLKSFSEKK